MQATVVLPADVTPEEFMQRYALIQEKVESLRRERLAAAAIAAGQPVDDYIAREDEFDAHIKWYFANNEAFQAEQQAFLENSNRRLCENIIALIRSERARSNLLIAILLRFLPLATSLAMSDRKRKRLESTRPVASSSQHHSFDLAQFLPPAPDAPIVTRVNRVSGDNRRVYTEAVPVAPPSPVKRLRADAQKPAEAAAHLPLLDESERYSVDAGDEEDDDESLGAGTSAGPPRPADPAMSVWMREHRDTFLRVLLWRDGRGSAADICPQCKTRASCVRCRDCLNAPFTCAECCVQLHAHNPLHWIERWNGVYFERTSLRACGLQIQLGHEDDHSHCLGRVLRLLPFQGRRDHVQLLKGGYYPATLDSPRTCVTFACLDFYQTLSFHGKTTAYDFYSTLETLSNGVGIKPPDRYRVFLRVARQWRHLHLLKRAGRGHDKCPACPRPGINLPEDWADAAPEDKCLYTMVIALDACFRLKRRLFSSWVRDPGLGTGWAYLVEALGYEKFIASVGEQKERCYAATGVAMGICARHEFILPTAVADLQKGERYANIDWIFMSLLRHLIGLLWIIVSYDIACQWSKNLKERLAALPPLVRLQAIQALLAAMRFAIPKMHVKGHILACQLLFAFWLIRGSGQVDGEGIERTWSSLGGVAASTRVSGPGSRADQLDDHLGFWNWVKLIRLAALLHRRLQKARSELAKQEADLQEFSKHQAGDVEQWKAEVDAFEADASKPNPYAVEIVGMTEREVRNRFEEEEAAAEAAGRIRLHDVGPAEFLELVLRVEEDQRRVHSLASLKRAKTTAVKINLRRHRRRLNKSIARIRVLQATYMPAALTYLDGLKLSPETPAELVPILAPSALPESLHVKARFLVYKKVHSRHQGANTRSRALVARNENKILLHCDKYQAARRALVALRGSTTEELVWPPLLREDIRCMDGDGGAFEPQEVREDVFGRSASRALSGGKTREGETRRSMSWIWMFTETAGTDGEMRAALKVEWCKSICANASLEGGERLWVQRAGSVDVGGTDTALAEGLIAYASKQVEVYRGLARRAEGVRTAPALRRGQARPREVEGEDPLVVPGTETERAGGSADEHGGGDGAAFHPDEAIEEFVDELGNASDDEDDRDDEEYILNGDAYD
ncbi:CxC2 domain-containing protein [Mycena kentingensis (nom. inval.)]|nr:CxC2 domain-containing protein [Mycena kentingensis (nom. inval.)]